MWPVLNLRGVLLEILFQFFFLIVLDLEFTKKGACDQILKNTTAYYLINSPASYNKQNKQKNNNTDT